MTLHDVDLVVRNPGWHHDIRLDATPAHGLGQRVSLQAKLTSPFWSLHPGRWSEWSGTVFGELPTVDLAKLAIPADLSTQIGLKVSHGAGALRFWLDVNRGRVTGGTTDVALADVSAQFAHASQDLELTELGGRFTLALKPNGWELSTHGLRCTTRSGTHWVNGQVRLGQQRNKDSARTQWELDASNIQLDALREVAGGLPLQPQFQKQLTELQPSGEVDTLTLRWTNTEAVWEEFKATGKIRHLALAAQTLPASLPNSTPALPGRPGFQGANLEFDFNHEGGQAKLGLSQGQLTFPGVFEDAQIPMDKLVADIRWTIKGDQIQATLNGVRFSNSDLEGQATASWRTSDPGTSPGKSRFPGVLKLDGTLVRGKAERVHRYLPLVISETARDYVKEAIVGGKARDVRFHVVGDLYQMPFRNAADGEFRITAKITDVNYAFVPAVWIQKDGLPWPTLKNMDGELVFDRLSMSLKGAKGSISDAPGLKVAQAQAQIASLDRNPVVEVNARIDGPLNDALAVVRRSPLSTMTSQALQSSTGSGNAQIQFGLVVPLLDLSGTTVNGKVTLPGNDLMINPDSILLAKTKGAIEFNEQGFNVPQASARFLGGDLQFSGGMKVQDGFPTMQFRGQGTATAEGLRAAPQLGFLASLADQAAGSAAYTAQWSMRQGVPQMTVQTTLQGLQLNVPAPLGKSADVLRPVRYSTRVVDPTSVPVAPVRNSSRRVLPETPSPRPTHDVMSVEMGSPADPLLALTFVRNVSGQTPVIERGQLLVGQAVRDKPDLPQQGVTLHIDWPQFDADQWEQAFVPWTDGASGPAKPPRPEPPVAIHPIWPDRLILSTGQLRTSGRLFHAVKLDASRSGQAWTARVSAQEMLGSLEYRPAQQQAPGQLIARLDRLTLKTAPESANHQTEASVISSQAVTMPALDVQVDALELDGRSLGRLDLLADNRIHENNAREWRLSRLNLQLPEAVLNATGNWAESGTYDNLSKPAIGGRVKRTALKFKLDVNDSGALLQRFGMPGVFKGGKGTLDGHLAWLGPPSAFDTPSLTGQVKLDLASGQFLKAEPGLAKLLGVLSLQSLPRRLTLDFSDVFSQGFAFDFIRGDAVIDRGVARTNNLQMKGVNAAVLLEGQADIGKETQDIRALVVPELNAGTASLIATVINPAVGLGTFLAQAILRQPLIQASTQEFRIHGGWADPQVDKTSAPPLTTSDQNAPVSNVSKP